MTDEVPLRGFDFARYVSQRKDEVVGGDGSSRYAYAADIAMLRTFRRIRPVELAAAATVRMYKDILRNQLLGTTIRVGPRQFPSLHRIAEQCAHTLGVPTPVVYVTNSPVVNAYTFGTDDEAFIVIHSALVDHFDEDELRFVIGHETGHIQNKHVIYGTILILMKQTTVALMAYLAPPVEIALQSWYRRAEITCDRAGLLCTGKLEPAVRSFLKLACGSKKLYAELNVEAYLEQLQDGRQGLGRFSELFASHPYIPKRIEALRAFGESAMFRERAGLGPGGLSIPEVDARTSEIIQIVKG